MGAMKGGVIPMQMTGNDRLYTGSWAGGAGRRCGAQGLSG